MVVKGPPDKKAEQWNLYIKKTIKDVELPEGSVIRVSYVNQDKKIYPIKSIDDLKNIVASYGNIKDQYIYITLTIDILANSIQELQKRTQQYYQEHNEIYPNLNLNINIQDELEALDYRTINIRHRTNKILNEHYIEKLKSSKSILLDDDHKDKNIPGVGEDDHQINHLELEPLQQQQPPPPPLKDEEKKEELEVMGAIIPPPPSSSQEEEEEKKDDSHDEIIMSKFDDDQINNLQKEKDKELMEQQMIDLNHNTMSMVNQKITEIQSLPIMNELNNNNNNNNEISNLILNPIHSNSTRLYSQLNDEEISFEEQRLWYYKHEEEKLNHTSLINISPPLDQMMMNENELNQLNHEKELLQQSPPQLQSQIEPEIMIHNLNLNTERNENINEDKELLNHNNNNNNNSITLESLNLKSPRLIQSLKEEENEDEQEEPKEFESQSKLVISNSSNEIQPIEKSLEQIQFINKVKENEKEINEEEEKLDIHKKNKLLKHKTKHFKKNKHCKKL